MLFLFFTDWDEVASSTIQLQEQKAKEAAAVAAKKAYEASFANCSGDVEGARKLAEAAAAAAAQIRKVESSESYFFYSCFIFIIFSYQVQICLSNKIPLYILDMISEC